ncbi:hypothetical protein DPMN_118259 [Dreissena polymorpha]|uniref:Uncharacterized protein n=2 Tax=Dreissena polymorpha TaxID=45954 RepID=A0A9D4JQ29_DREPO|nr:hypothetical protein DPMN_118259 [Dreissena polymorpha]
MRETNSGSVCFKIYFKSVQFTIFAIWRSGQQRLRYPPHTDDKYAKAAWFLGSGKQPKTGWFW